MEDEDRRRLQRARVRLVKEMQVEPLWAPLLRRGLFSRDMLEEIQRAGTRRDQARQLVTDLQTRGKQALPTFIQCLQETGQRELAALLSVGCSQDSPRPIEIHPSAHPIGPCTPSYFPLALETSHSFRGQGHVVDEKPPEARSHIPAPRVPGEGDPRRNPEMVYVLRSNPCGYCLIINNVNFEKGTDLKPRLGSDIDCKRLERRFRALHFEVLVKQDLKAQEIAQELQSLARRDHSSRDSCLVVILSHGCESYHFRFPGAIFGTDGQRIAMQKIVSYFNGSHCPSLGGKPKLFFIQACGGDEKDQGFQVDAEISEDRPDRNSLESDAIPIPGPEGDHDETDAIANLPTESDILVCYPTVPGYVSWRDTESGSWYIEALDQALEQYAHLEDLPSILTKVGNMVSAKVAGRYKQMPGYFNFLRKKFFFMV